MGIRVLKTKCQSTSQIHLLKWGQGSNIRKDIMKKRPLIVWGMTKLSSLKMNPQLKWGMLATLLKRKRNKKLRLIRKEDRDQIREERKSKGNLVEKAEIQKTLWISLVKE